MIENNCSCSVLSNKIDKSIIRRYDNNKGRKRSGLDKSKLQAVEKAKESLAVQGFLPVRRAPLVRALASHARGRRFESASLHHQAAPKKMPLRKAQKFQRLPGFFAPIFRGVTKRCQLPCQANSMDLYLYPRRFEPLFRGFFGKVALFCPRQSVEF